jgi:hypothetical protein
MGLPKEHAPHMAAQQNRRRKLARAYAETDLTIGLNSKMCGWAVVAH